MLATLRGRHDEYVLALNRLTNSDRAGGRSVVTVIGDVKTPNQLPLNVNGTRVLDAVALAGGATAPAFDSIVQLNRGGVTRRVRLSWILAHPARIIPVVGTCNQERVLSCAGAAELKLTREQWFFILQASTGGPVP